MKVLFTRIAGYIAFLAGQPAAFLLALLTVVLWAVTGPIFDFSATWQLVINTGTTIVTFMMVFLVQNTQNRDSSAIQAKLDELIRAIDTAENSYIGIEHLTEEQIDSIRRELEEAWGQGEKWGSPETIRRFQRRR